MVLSAIRRPLTAAARNAASLLTVVVCLSSAVGFGQTTILDAQQRPANARGAIDDWRTYLPAGRTQSITACESYTAYATDGSVILEYRASGELRRLDKVNVLSQSDVLVVACNPYKEGQLLVLYSDGAIDIIEDERVINYLTAIADADVPGRRQVEGIEFVSETEALVYAEFGFVVLDPTEGLFRDDVRTTEPLTDVAVLNGDLYLANDKGLQVLRDYKSQISLRDTNRYTTLTQTLFDTTRARVRSLAVWQNNLYAAVDRLQVDSLIGIYRIDDGELAVQVEADDCQVTTRLTANDEQLAAVKRTRCPGPVRDSIRYLTIDNPDVWQTIGTACAPFISSATPVPGGGVAFGYFDGTNGLCRTESTGGSCDCIELNTPRAASSFAVATGNGQVVVTSGGLTAQRGPTLNADGAYVLDTDGKWINYNRSTTQSFASEFDAQGQVIDSFASPLDLITVAIAEDSTIWLGSYYDGLVRINADGSSIKYDERNSSLGNNRGDVRRSRVGGLAIDQQGTLWVANSGAARALSSFSADGVWRSYDVSRCGANGFFATVVDPSTGVVWLADAGAGVVAFDPAGTLDDVNDDRCTTFGISQNLPSADVRSLQFDRSGALIVGTVNGLASAIPGTSGDRDPFGGSFQFQRPAVVIDGIPGFAFDGESIRSIAVDGGNRKYIGTDNGLFLVSPDLREQLSFFTIDNSPLIDNQIDGLSFDDDSGQLWIATPSGLMSLQTPSTGGRELVHGSVEVYPQPVRPEYDGPIAIRGLALDSNVKITDAAGRLVFETEAIGGTATWNGRDYTGSKPATGVYFVWATAANAFDSPNSVVAKIALVR